MPNDRFYKTPEWEAMRLAVIRRHNWVCSQCGVLALGARKAGAPSPHVDHIVSRRERPDLAMDPANLTMLCGPCHSRKTRRLDCPRAGHVTGADGWPVE